MRWWVLLVLVGCYAPTAPAGAPCAEGRTCPDGLVCETVSGADVCILPGSPAPDAAIDAPDGFDGPPVDTDSDGDGVLDEQDTCPSIADDQHDEDADGLGDACDPCPIYDSLEDADGDGLPEGCDLFPMMGGDRLARFHAFHVRPPGWTVGAAWTFSEDAAQFVQTNMGSQYITAPDALVGTTLVMTQVQVGEFGMNGGVGVGFGSSTSGISCGFASSGGTYQLVQFDTDQSVTLASVNLPNFSPDVPWAVVFVRSAENEFQCVATDGMNTNMTATVVNPQPAALQPFVVATAVDARVEYLLVTINTLP